MSTEANLKEFRATIRRVIKEAKKEESEALNKNALKALIGAKGVKGAVHTTRKVTRAQIKRDLARYRPHDLIFRLATMKLKKEGHAVTRPNIRATAEQIFKKRDQSRAYLAAGWLKCARDLGGKNRPPRPNGGAAKSYAIKATSNRLVVAAYNVATGENGSVAEGIARIGLNEAIRNATEDMKEYLRQRVEKVLKENSDP